MHQPVLICNHDGGDHHSGRVHTLTCLHAAKAVIVGEDFRVGSPGCVRIGFPFGLDAFNFLERVGISGGIGIFMGQTPLLSKRTANTVDDRKVGQRTIRPHTGNVGRPKTLCDVLKDAWTLGCDAVGIDIANLDTIFVGKAGKHCVQFLRIHIDDAKHVGHS